MNAADFLKKLDFRISDDEREKINFLLKKIISKLKENLSKKKIFAGVFVGGSYGKNTMIKSAKSDVDLFVRFENEKAILKFIEVFPSFKMEEFGEVKRIHGSRDYYRIDCREVCFEIVPVVKIRKPSEEKNVTDLSYFHVGYLRRKMNSELERNISLAKKFCKANKVYGAESFVHGFSGYAIECLILHYKNFLRMLKELSNSKEEKIIIDIEKVYKNKKDALVEMNESKTSGPIVLVDPTWKERNVLAALNSETFEKFRAKSREFLKKPSIKLFEEREFSEQEFLKNQKRGTFLKIELSSDRQEGDIAGTKMKKYYEFLKREIEKYYEVKKSDFFYGGGQISEIYFVINEKKKIRKAGPFAEDKKNLKKFKEANRNWRMVKDRAYSDFQIDVDAREFVEQFRKKETPLFPNKGIENLKIIEFRKLN